jgi:hypothetical protein
LPWSFWIGALLALVATAVWLSGRVTMQVHFLLVFVWTLFLFWAPELLETNGRVNDTYDWLIGLSYLKSGRLSVKEGFGYAIFPGYFFLAQSLSEICDLGYYQLAGHIMALSLHAIRSFAIVVFMRSVFHSQTAVLAASLLMTILLWMPGTHAASHGMGFALLLFSYALVFRRLQTNQDRLVLLILFAGLIITHAPTTFLLVLLLSLTAFLESFPWGRIWIRASRGRAMKPALLWALWLPWLIYPAYYVFRDTVLNAPHLLSRPLERALVPYTQHLTPLRTFNIAFSLSYIGLVGLWILACLRFRSRGRNLRQVLYPLHGILPTFSIPLISAVSIASFERIYAYSTPFLAWFLTRNTQRKRLLPVLCFGFFLFLIGRYANEAVVTFPTSEIHGATFVTRTIPPPSVVLYVGLKPQASSLSNSILQTPNIYEGDRVRSVAAAFEVLSKADFAVFSPSVRNLFLYYWSDDDWTQFTSHAFVRLDSMVYDSGSFRVYARLGPQNHSP